MVANVGTCDSSFTRTVDISRCGVECVICVRATSDLGEGEEACVPVTTNQCSELTSTWCVVDGV